MPRRFIFSALIVLVMVSQCLAQTAPVKFRISGRTVNAVTGQILAGSEVSIGKADQFDSTVQKMLTGTDGAFAFTVQDPGKYLLEGKRNGFRKQGYEQHGAYLSAVVVGQGLLSENLVFRLRPDARITGTIVDDESEPVPNASIYLFRTDASIGLRAIYLESQTTSDDRGTYHFAHLESGWYYIVVSAQPWFGSFAPVAEAMNPSSPEKTAFDLVFPTTFYPGVTDSASASQIVLEEGQKYTADLNLTAIPALRVHLDHFNANPAKPRGATLRQKIFGTTINTFSQRQTPLDDSIEIRGVPPGKYVLDIQSYDATRATISTFINLVGDMDLDVDRSPSMPPIRGTVRLDGGVNLQPQAFVRLWNSHTDETLDAQIGQTGEFTFDADFVTPGSYSVFVVNGLNSTICSLSATGAQVAGQTIRIAGSKQVQLGITLCQNLSTINGTARSKGQPAAGAMILLVPENPELNLPLFRRDQSDSDGTFTLRDVVPGRYKILAIENGWDLEWANSALLKPRLLHVESSEVQPSKTYQTAVDVK
jgi:Carboxypeptidase regulatory-like domain